MEDFIAAFLVSAIAAIMVGFGWEEFKIVAFLGLLIQFGVSYWVLTWKR